MRGSKVKHERLARVAMREAAAAKRAAGLARLVDSPGVNADALKRSAEIPADTRCLTARLFGDPIPGDPRRANPERTTT